MHTSSSHTDKALAASNQATLSWLRFLGYCGAQLNAILVPLLVYKLSASTALAGLALVIEWVPKLGLYLVGGSLVQRFTPARAHLALELLRFLAMGLLFACAQGYGTVWAVAIAAAGYQCANAVSNILFEQAVTRWWAPDERATGHAQMLRSDQLGCVCMLGLGLALSSPAWLAALGLGMQVLSAVRVHRARSKLYAVSPGSAVRSQDKASLADQLRQDAKATRHPALLRFALTGALLGIPAATAFSALAFLLARAQPGAVADAHAMALLLLVRTALSLAALQFAKQRLKLPGEERRLAVGGLSVLVLATLALAVPGNMYWLMGVMALLGASSYLYLPLLRTIRQELISELVASTSRSGVTGMLIAMEACSYLAGAAMLALLGTRLDVLCLIVAMLGAVGSWMLFRRALAPVRPNPATTGQDGSGSTPNRP